jgi:hypothetical protein
MWRIDGGGTPERRVYQVFNPSRIGWRWIKVAPPETPEEPWDDDQRSFSLSSSGPTADQFAASPFVARQPVFPAQQNNF